MEFGSSNPPAELGETRIKLQIRLERDEAVYSESHRILAMVSLKAPLWNDQSISHHSRAPVDLVAVVDRSDSMRGDKLQLVKLTLEFVIHQLKETDSFGIVLYGTQVDTLLPPTKMSTQATKVLAMALVDKIQARGVTNLSGGLFQALTDLKDMPAKNAVASVLLFTDGLANTGVKDIRQIVRSLGGLMSQIDNACTCFTFGFGADHDVNLLKSIADEANGIYYYIQDHNAIADAFADCIGGLLSVCAKQLRLRLEAPLKSHVRLVPLPTRFKCAELAAGSAFEIAIPDLYSDEERDILVHLELPPLDAPSDKLAVLDCELRYVNLIAPECNRETTTASARRPAVAAAPQQPTGSVEMDVQRNRVNASTALDQAKRAADAGRFDEARAVLRSAVQAIEASGSAANPLCRRLVDELNECLAELVDTKAYTVTGTRKMANYASSHWQQRSGYTNSPYVTKSKSSMVDAHRAFSHNSPRRPLDGEAPASSPVRPSGSMFSSQPNPVARSLADPVFESPPPQSLEPVAPGCASSLLLQPAVEPGSPAQHNAPAVPHYSNRGTPQDSPWDQPSSSSSSQQ
eukprot:TRINITY_DN4623_c0_g1_i3.p1 TRINITY_DN4623_c0_g1~~TRINITY_DN4623_c0_g1_i3.p1  ORF type:complete len:575 (-),score=165.99 TRINITY_DN4623_c0_g1_i3:393-2117(-)